MPNWNTTDYTLYGNKDNIKRLYTDLKNTVDIDRTKENKPFTFLGNSYWLVTTQLFLIDTIHS